LLVTSFLLAAFFATGCANGTYPLDIFYEMHYQQSYGVQEPPRISVPRNAVPVTGRVLFGTENPIPGQRVEEGARLFAANCAFCHGATGKGDGPVLGVMRDRYNYPQRNPNGDYTITPDLTSDFVAGQPDVGLFAWMTSGVTVMPSFARVLSVEERWLLVNYIRTLRQ
jgi:mono/diheme cytochrome c family protein